MSLKIEAAVTPTILRLADALELHEATIVSHGRFEDHRVNLLETTRLRAKSEFHRYMAQAGANYTAADAVDAVFRVIDERRAYRKEKAVARKRRQEALREEQEMAQALIAAA